MCRFFVTNVLRHARFVRRVIVTVMRDFFVASLSPSPSCASSSSRRRHRLLRHEDADGRVIVTVFFLTNFLRHACLRRVIVTGMRDCFVASSSPSPMLGKWLANARQLLGECLANGCQLHGKCLARLGLASARQMLGKWLANGWQMLGTCLANAWRIVGNMLGKLLANCWQMLGQGLANAWGHIGGHASSAECAFGIASGSFGSVCGR